PALGAYLEVLFELGPVQHCPAPVALLPEPLGHAAPLGARVVGADAGRHEFLEPGHAMRVPVVRKGTEPPCAGRLRLPDSLTQRLAQAAGRPSSPLRKGSRKARARLAAWSGSALPAIADTSAL